MPPIVAITKQSAYDRRVEIAHEADDRQQRAIESVLARGFDFDWGRILGKVQAGAEDPTAPILREIDRQLASDEFGDTITALNLNGALLARLIVRHHEELAGVRADRRIVSFAEPDLSNPETALEFWMRMLGMDAREATDLLARIAAQQRARDEIAARIRSAAAERIQAIFARHPLTGTDVAPGESLAAFIADAQATMPDATRANLETEYRTRIATEYSTRNSELIASRSNTFPFLQFMAIKDGRTTWWICLPMGKAGPNGTGYIAATGDAIWIVWRLPAHFGCRSLKSPIGYREAQRIGILASDGRTKIAIRGSNPDRPFGDPPDFATDPATGSIRRVEPQEGFGA